MLPIRARRFMIDGRIDGGPSQGELPPGHRKIPSQEPTAPTLPAHEQVQDITEQNTIQIPATLVQDPMEGTPPALRVAKSLNDQELTRKVRIKGWTTVPTPLSDNEKFLLSEARLGYGTKLNPGAEQMLQKREEEYYHVFGQDKPQSGIDALIDTWFETSPWGILTPQGPPKIKENKKYEEEILVGRILGTGATIGASYLTGGILGGAASSAIGAGSKLSKVATAVKTVTGKLPTPAVSAVKGAVKGVLIGGVGALEGKKGVDMWEQGYTAPEIALDIGKDFASMFAFQKGFEGGMSRFLSSKEYTLGKGDFKTVERHEVAKNNIRVTRVKNFPEGKMVEDYEFTRVGKDWEPSKPAERYFELHRPEVTADTVVYTPKEWDPRIHSFRRLQKIKPTLGEIFPVEHTPKTVIPGARTPLPAGRVSKPARFMAGEGVLGEPGSLTQVKIIDTKEAGMQLKNMRTGANLIPQVSYSPGEVGWTKFSAGGPTAFYSYDPLLQRTNVELLGEIPSIRKMASLTKIKMVKPPSQAVHAADLLSSAGNIGFVLGGTATVSRNLISTPSQTKIDIPSISNPFQNEKISPSANKKAGNDFERALNIRKSMRITPSLRKSPAIHYFFNIPSETTIQKTTQDHFTQVFTPKFALDQDLDTGIDTNTDTTLRPHLTPSPGLSPQIQTHEMDQGLFRSRPVVPTLIGIEDTVPITTIPGTVPKVSPPPISAPPVFIPKLKGAAVRGMREHRAYKSQTRKAKVPIFSLKGLRAVNPFNPAHSKRKKKKSKGHKRR